MRWPCTDIIAAKNDPIIPLSSYDEMKIGNKVNFHLTKFGGHMGYLSANKTRFQDRRWLDEAVVNWVEQNQN